MNLTVKFETTKGNILLHGSNNEIPIPRKGDWVSFFVYGKRLKERVEKVTYDYPIGNVGKSVMVVVVETTTE